MKSSVASRQSVPEILASLIEQIPGAEIATHHDGARWAVIRLSLLNNPSEEIPRIAETLGAMPVLRYAEPDFVVEAIGWPDDPLHSAANHWWPDMIEMEGAWTEFEAWRAMKDPAVIPKVLIAIFDTGISIAAGDQSDHEDLSDGRVITTHKDAGGNPVDHDYSDATGVPKDWDGHGTHVTGIAVATANNAAGVAGVSWTASVYVARVLGEATEGFNSSVKTALEHVIAYASDQGFAHIVANMSLATQMTAEAVALQEFCERAGEVGAIVCCGSATRLEGTTLLSSYPSVYAGEFDHVISVAYSDSADDVRYPTADVPEITVVAPGKDINSTYPTYAIDGIEANYGVRSGPSMAAPIVSGIISMMWTRNEDLTPLQIKEALRNTADIVWRNGIDYRRVNASVALRGAVCSIALDTPTLVFKDVPEGESKSLLVEMTVSFGDSLEFEVTPESRAALDLAFEVTVDTMTYVAMSDSVTGIKVRYAAGVAGTVAFDQITIRCVETLEEWTVYLLANAAGLPDTALALVLDKSSSMRADSGVETMSRMEVLLEAAEIVVDAVRVGSSVGAVTFAGDASVVSPLVAIAGESATSPERTTLKSKIAAVVPEGSTSIGDGVRLGHEMVATAAQSNRGLLVLTDGHENTAELIADVMDEVTIPVYAVGMGTAEVIQPDRLADLTDATGGYVVLTGALTDQDRYKVAKYCLQILAGISGSSLIVDPSGIVRPKQPIDIPLAITRMDSNVEILVLGPSKNLFDVALVDPDGKPLRPTRERVGLQLAERWGAHVGISSARFGNDAKERRPGTWRARFGLDADRFGEYVGEIADRAAKTRAQFGAPYCVMVTCRSGLRMHVRAHATGTRPGGSFLLRAIITEHGLPGSGSTKISARIAEPGGLRTDVVLVKKAEGVYEASFPAAIAGVYTCLVRAQGVTSEGDRFTREQTVTAHFWREPGTTAIAAVPGPSRIIR